MTLLRCGAWECTKYSGDGKRRHYLDSNLDDDNDGAHRQRSKSKPKKKKSKYEEKLERVDEFNLWTN